MNDKKILIPITYSVDNNYNDERFIKLRIDICHDGLNKNGSEFSINAFEKSKGTLKNIPILAYVKQTEDGYDFDGHNVDVDVDKDGNVNIVYLEQPIGVIPETNEYEHVEKDGKTYVRAVGYVWRKYTNIVEDIIENRQNLMVSMEIMVTDYSEKNKIINIKDYYYSAITLLGEDVKPGMYDSIAKVEKFALSFEEREGRIKEMTDELKEYIIEFKLSMEKKRSILFKCLYEKYREYKGHVYLIETYDDYIIYGLYDFEKDENRYFKLDYIVNNEDIELSESGVELFVKFLTKEQVNELNEKEKTYTALNNEVAELRKFKRDIEDANIKIEKENLINQFSALLDKEVITKFANEVDNYSLDELKGQLSIQFAMREISKIKPKNNEVKTAVNIVAVNTNTKELCI